MPTEDKRRILNMLAEGKLTTAEAEHLLEALEPKSVALTVPSGTNTPVSTPHDPKFLRVLVEGHDQEHGAARVNVRVPFALIRAGIRLAALVPAAAHEPINRALKENGVDIDISKIKPENLEELVTHLREFTVDVESGAGEKVRVFCE